MIARFKSIQPFWNSPVVIRDMRVRLRGPRAFLSLAIYLLLLIILALAGYLSAVTFMGVAGSDPAGAQNVLRTFYYFIFETLAALIGIIAPALTAAVIVYEKQSKTYDLLVTTSMTPLQMLTGKLISSIAFILLLLAASIPCSALCVILGGATVSDVFQSYVLLTIDGLVLATIGLTYSCNAKQAIHAIVGTYGMIIVMLVLTSIAGSALAASALVAHYMGHSAPPMPAMYAFAALNPFTAVTNPSSDVALFGLNCPLWLATGVVAVLIIRLMLTGAAYSLGVYGDALLASLRRQILYMTALLAFVFTLSIEALGAPVLMIVCGLFGVSILFLPMLFVPAVDEDGPPGQVVRGQYSFRNAFSANHSGAMPYFHIWLIILAASVVAGAATADAFPAGPIFPIMGRVSGLATPDVVPWKDFATQTGISLVYTASLSFLIWCVARRSAWITQSRKAAQGLTFLITASIIFLPLVFMNMIDRDLPFKTPLVYVWILYPFTVIGHKSISLDWPSFLWTSAFVIVAGTSISPWWKDVVPAAGAVSKDRAAKAQRITS